MDGGFRSGLYADGDDPAKYEEMFNGFNSSLASAAAEQ